MESRRFKPSQAHRLDAPERSLWLPAADVLHALHLQPGETITDIGAGTGYFALPLAREAGPRGLVYAVDAETEMLALLKRKIDQHYVGNVHLIHAEADRTGLGDGCCDLVFMANVWHEFEDRAAVLYEAVRILRRPGRIAIVDWRPDAEREPGPPLDHRIAAATAAGELRSAGFTEVSERKIGRYSWLVQARRI